MQMTFADTISTKARPPPRPPFTPARTHRSRPLTVVALMSDKEVGVGDDGLTSDSSSSEVDEGNLGPTFGTDTNMRVR